MTIAGSDSGGGAGIQADLKTFTALGVYGTTVVTAVTAQTSVRVVEAMALPASLVVAQFDAVVSDMPPDAIKIGMLGSLANVEIVAARLRTCGVEAVVLDPVLASTSGRTLLDSGALGALRTEILPLSLVVTPNLMEAEALVEAPVRDLEGMEEAARRLHAMGAANVLVTGGHLGGDTAVDVFYDGRAIGRLSRPRIARSPHGTGCVLSAAIAAYLAKGHSPEASVAGAKDFVTASIQAAFQAGQGDVCDPRPLG